LRPRPIDGLLATLRTGIACSERRLIAMTDQAQDMADWIDSNILEDVYRASKMLNEAPIPLIGRYFYNPETNKVEAIPDPKP
jgi:hypothetical protein